MDEAALTTNDALRLDLELDSDPRELDFFIRETSNAPGLGLASSYSCVDDGADVEVRRMAGSSDCLPRAGALPPRSRDTA